MSRYREDNDSFWNLPLVSLHFLHEILLHNVVNILCPAFQVHTFLVYSIVMCTAAMTLEIFVRDDIRDHSHMTSEREEGGYLKSRHI